MTAEYVQPQIVSSVRAMSSSSTAPIVGRQRELKLMMSHYEAARNGLARVVLLSGEPGIGKTRLLDEIARHACDDGAIVLRGGASEAEGMPPYLPFLEALGQHIRITPVDQLREQIAAVPQILASLLPELAIRLGDLPISHPVLPEQARFRLYEAIGTFLAVIGAPHVLLLILDDLHWADTASLDLLCHLMRHQSNAHLLVLGAYRECEIDSNPVLACTLTELSRQRVLATVAVGPLSLAETSILAENQLGGPLSAGVNVLLGTQSEGNPFFAEELLDNWLEIGALVQKQNQWVATAPLDQALPPSIIGALRQRFARLSAESIDYLRVAAIIGRSFDLWLLTTVQRQEIEVVEERLLEAGRAQLVRADHAGRFTFSHDKIRECLYDEVSMSRRRRLHGLIGRILETRYEDEKTMSVYRLAELAFHFVHSNDQDRGVAYSQRAAAHALHAFAAEEAMSHYRTALSLLNPDDRRRGDLLLGLGEAALLAGKEEEAEIAYKGAQCCQLQDGDQGTLARSTFLRQIHGLLAYRREDYTLAERELQAAMAEQDQQMGLGMIMFYLGLLGLVQATIGKREEAYAHMARVEAQLDLLPDGILPTTPLMMCLALTALMLGDQERAAHFYPRLLAFRGQRSWFLVDRVLGQLATLRHEWQTAEMHLAEAEATARREDLRPELARTHLAQADLEQARGDQGSTLRAREMLNQALVLFEELGMADSLHRVRCQFRSLSPQLDDPTCAPLPANLTQREAEVLKLVAQGKSNRQIAHELHLTEKTVTNHLTHIFNKTICQNRAAATAFAIRHGLA